MTVCINPACTMPRGVYRRCRACYVYHYRHGGERPARTHGRAGVDCTMAACPRRGFRRGLCRQHYRRWLPQRAHRLPAPCANPACAAFAGRRSRGRCPACYAYHWRHGAERPDRLTHPRSLPCCVAACAQPVQARGLCNTHYIALWRAERRARLAVTG